MSNEMCPTIDTTPYMVKFNNHQTLEKHSFSQTHPWPSCHRPKSAYAMQMPCLLPSYPTRYEATSLCLINDVVPVRSQLASGDITPYANA